MSEYKNHTEIKKHISGIREGITAHKGISTEARKKAIEKLNIVQSHVDENKVTESTAQHLRDIITHLEENPKLIALVEEVLAFLPH
jgi:hypothetical protein